MFSETDSAKVAELVRAVEARTSGEVAVVWAPRADDYVLVRGLWSLALAAVIAAELAMQGIGLSAVWLPGLTVAVAIVLYVGFGGGPLLRWIVPDVILSERVHRRAQVAFLEFGVTETAARGGVLVFLSALEHRVEILADRGIATRVDPGVWQLVVDELVAALKAGQAMSGIAHALERIGNLLETEFPRGADDKNELADAPRELR